MNDEDNSLDEARGCGDAYRRDVTSTFVPVSPKQRSPKLSDLARDTCDPYDDVCVRLTIDGVPWQPNNERLKVSNDHPFDFWKGPPLSACLFLSLSFVFCRFTPVRSRSLLAFLSFLASVWSHVYAGRKGNNNIAEISALRPGREFPSLVHP